MIVVLQKTPLNPRSQSIFHELNIYMLYIIYIYIYIYIYVERERELSRERDHNKTIQY